jgi:hypothetical protein
MTHDDRVVERRSVAERQRPSLPHLGQIFAEGSGRRIAGEASYCGGSVVLRGKRRIAGEASYCGGSVVELVLPAAVWTHSRARRG